ncbi:MAG: 5-formyltetrahydrofolate cyclo-ligase [Lachnospiraceae bacterium]|nr:5-formyltetrahydrofolate cyclo-ligase [Lachnospiraceae bacterium]
MEDTALKENKEILRNRIILLRECMTSAERENAGLRIFENFFKLPEYQNAETIFAFAGFGTEVPTLNSVFKMINSGKKVSLPRVQDDEHMDFYEVRKISDIRKSKIGIPEPFGECEKASYRPDMILVPGSVFDLNMNRLGYGRGYYDRYLREKGYEKVVWKIALSLACQVVDQVPTDENDVPVDMIITEKGIIR